MRKKEAVHPVMPWDDPEQGLVSAIQKYSTRDGPGIRSTVFLKGCPLGCLWCGNPELVRPAPDLLYDRERCARCGTCVAVCPREALFSAEDGYTRIDRTACDGCGECVDACPESALELAGKLMGADELATELLKDHVFYQTSGGGVTFSGGEPLWQSGFVARTAARVKAAGIHTALDTAGGVSWDRFEEVLNLIDLVLFDLKVADSETHRRYTGQGNELILANLRLLSERGASLHMRLLMAPGLNDNEAEIRARMAIVATLKNVKRVDILPYHRYGIGKYRRLGLDYSLADLPEYSEQCLADIKALVASYGIPTTLGG